MNIKKMHHVAYRCNNAAETVSFYTEILNLRFSHAVRNDHVPSTGEFYPHLHIFFELGDGSAVAFFELPAEHPMGRDPHTPDWVQHLALELADESSLMSWHARLLEAGLEVIGPTDHGFVKSIYFFDPSGHRLELTCPAGPDEDADLVAAHAARLLEDWQRDRRAWTT